jgi:CheY-like chemotaxis protein
MGAKRALIVDDSKSARLFLARVLQDFEIDVDSAETAEAAIDYLSSNRPDVIFMDHQMPGMDGLQAVQAIKNDPRTATIPIMMYTSQEGELYLGQARALGALGVLPKQIKPADVSKVLYQLHLVPDRRVPEQSSFTPVGPAAVAFEHTPAGTRPLTDSTLREHFAELRRALIAVVDTQTDRITAEVRASLRETLPSPAEPVPPPEPPTPWAWIVASLALAVALASIALWWRSERALESVAEQLAQLRTVPAAAAPLPQPQAPAAAAAPARAADTRLLSALVPYGADAFGGPRLEVISKLLYRLARQGTTGMVEIKSYAGRFCMVGGATEGYSVAPEEMPFARCDVVGNPADEALTPVQRVPLPLVNLIGDIRSSTHGALDVQVAVGDPANLVAPYPPPGTYLTAGEWNRAASANNRIEIRLR